MSIENVEKFYGLLAEDKELREKITNAGEELKSRLKTKEDVKGKGVAEVFALLELSLVKPGVHSRWRICKATKKERSGTSRTRSWTRWQGVILEEDAFSWDSRQTENRDGVHYTGSLTAIAKRELYA